MRLPSSDGHQFNAYVPRGNGPWRGALVVVQEILDGPADGKIGMQAASQAGLDAALRDVQASIEYARQQLGKKVGVLGFCWVAPWHGWLPRAGNRTPMAGCRFAALTYIPIYHAMQSAAGNNVVTVKSTHNAVTGAISLTPMTTDPTRHAGCG